MGRRRVIRRRRFRSSRNRTGLNPYRSRRPVIGFYTDKQGRIRPITAPKRKIFYNYYPLRIVKVKRPEFWYTTVLPLVYKKFIFEIPAAREIYLAYRIANLIYSNWGTIKEIIDDYKKKKDLGEVIVDHLPSLTSKAVWHFAKNYIPEEYRDYAERIIAETVESLTMEEIEFVRRSL